MLADEALRSMSMQLERLYSTTGRLSIPPEPEQLPRALRFQVLYTVCSEQASDGGAGLQPAVPVFRRVEQDDPAWDRMTFGKNLDRLPAGEVVATFFDAVSCRDHFI